MYGQIAPGNDAPDASHAQGWRRLTANLMQGEGYSIMLAIPCWIARPFFFVPSLLVGSLIGGLRLSLHSNTLVGEGAPSDWSTTVSSGGCPILQGSRNTSFYAFLSLARSCLWQWFSLMHKAWEVVCDLSCNLSCSSQVDASRRVGIALPAGVPRATRLLNQWLSFRWEGNRSTAQGSRCDSYGAHHAMPGDGLGL